MTRIKRYMIGMAIAIGIGTAFLNPVMPIIRVVQAQNTNCSGSFTPNFNCIITGVWLFSNGYTTSGGLLYNTSTTTLSNGQFLALNNTPITVVPLSAIPAGYVAVVTYGLISFNETSTYGAGSDMKLFYTSRVAGNAASGTITFAGVFDTAASNNEVFTGTVAGPEPGKTPRAIVIQQTTNTAMTGGSNSNVITVFVQYVLMPVGALS